MAKKKAVTTEFSVEDKLQALHKLQSIDSEIDKIRTVRGELPLEVQDLEDDLKGLETRIEKINSDITNKESFISKRKLAIKEAEELVKKYNKQLESIKNNREYDSLSKEIEFQNLPTDNVKVPGIYYFLFQRLSWEGVNITEVISTSNEFTILMDEDQVDIAFKVIKDLKNL